LLCGAHEASPELEISSGPRLGHGDTEIRGEFPAIKFSAALLPVSQPEYSAKVAQNLPRRDWGRGLRFKSLLLRHTVCGFSIQSGEGRKIARKAGFFHSERTGERGTERDSTVLAGILSAPNEVGSLSRLLTATRLLRRSIVTCDESKDTAKIDRLLRALGNGCT